MSRNRKLMLAHDRFCCFCCASDVLLPNFPFVQGGTTGKCQQEPWHVHFEMEWKSQPPRPDPPCAGQVFEGTQKVTVGGLHVCFDPYMTISVAVKSEMQTGKTFWAIENNLNYYKCSSKCRFLCLVEPLHCRVVIKHYVDIYTTL